MDAAPLTEDVLFLACTRPALVWGVPMEAMGLNLIASAVAFLAAGSPAWLLAAPVLHLVFRGVCRADPNAFRVLRLWLETRPAARNARLWGGASTTPLALRPRAETRHG
ncbi:type IV secretion system protein VirB3 [Phenylobacterium deserti]|uniref:Type IV secretion system protein VirB3 n=1 Tax=Phenylobacterium deserti TaxID=1914756 RepID=A0A328ADY9_9CAUL|nr:type IV secretion system protein VirB3 [Phenylobacterium deserti]RAK52775.1 type IV secretion system protein VirB3 [Phenylobacterium deserti]